MSEFVSEDGYPVGSIDVGKLDELEPQSDEARAAVEALKARAAEGNAVADQAAEESVQRVEAQENPVPEGEGTTIEAGPVVDNEGNPQPTADGEPAPAQPGQAEPAQADQPQGESKLGSKRGR